MGMTPPSRPGVYLYHMAPEDMPVGEFGRALIDPKALQVVEVERHLGGLVARIKTYDARTLVDPIAVNVDRISGMWSAPLDLRVDHPDFPDGYLSQDA